MRALWTTPAGVLGDHVPSAITDTHDGPRTMVVRAALGHVSAAGTAEEQGGGDGQPYFSSVGGADHS